MPDCVDTHREWDFLAGMEWCFVALLYAERPSRSPSINSSGAREVPEA